MSPFQVKRNVTRNTRPRQGWNPSGQPSCRVAPCLMSKGIDDLPALLTAVHFSLFGSSAHCVHTALPGRHPTSLAPPAFWSFQWNPGFTLYRHRMACLNLYSRASLPHTWPQQLGFKRYFFFSCLCFLLSKLVSDLNSRKSTLLYKDGGKPSGRGSKPT